jgi:hypothetical protein
MKHSIEFCRMSWSKKYAITRRWRQLQCVLDMNSVSNQTRWSLRQSVLPPEKSLLVEVYVEPQFRRGQI